MKVFLGNLYKKIVSTRLGRYSLRAVLFAIVWGVVLGLIAPAVAYKLVLDNVRSTFHTKFELENISFNPYTLNLTLDKLFLPYPDSSADSANDMAMDAEVKYFLAFDKLEVRLAWSSLISLAPVVANLELTKPQVDLSLLANGNLSVDAFIRYLPASPEKPAPVEQGAKPFPFILHNLEIKDGNVIVRDNINVAKQEISNLCLSLPFVSSIRKDNSTDVLPLLTAKIRDKEIRMEGKLLPFADSWRAEFRTVLDNIPLDTVKSYLSLFSTLELEKGTVGSDLVLAFEQQKNLGSLSSGLSITLQGLVRLEDILLKSRTADKRKASANVFSLKKGELELELLALNEDLFKVKSISLDSPIINAVYNEDGSIDWDNFLKPAVKITKVKPKAEASVVPSPVEGAEPKVAVIADPQKDPATVAPKPNAKPDAKAEPVKQTDDTPKADPKKLAVSDSDKAKEQGAEEQGTALPVGVHAQVQVGEKAKVGILFSLSSFDLFNGSFHFKDNSLAEPQTFDVKNIEVHLSNVDSQKRLEYFIIAAHLAENSTMRIDGELDFKAFDEKGLPNNFLLSSKLSLSELPLSLSNPRLKLNSPLEFKNGLVDAELDFSLALDTKASKAPELLISKSLLQLKDLALHLNNLPNPSIKLEKFELNGVKLDLAARQVLVDSLSFIKPEFVIKRNNAGEFDLLASFSNKNTQAPESANRGKKNIKAEKNIKNETKALKPTQTEPSAASKNSWAWAIKQIKIDNGALALNDEASKSSNSFNKISLDLKQLSSKVNIPSDLNLSFDLGVLAGSNVASKASVKTAKQASKQAVAKNAGVSTANLSNSSVGSFQLKGQIGLEPLNVNLNSSLKHLPLHGLNPFITGMGTAQIESAFLQGELKLQGERLSSQNPILNVKGDLNLLGLRLVDSAKSKTSELINLERLMAEKVDFNLNPLSLTIANLKLSSPVLNFTIEKDGVNGLARAFNPSQAAGSTSGKAVVQSTPKAQANLKNQPKKDSPVAMFKKFELANVELANGQVKIKDERIAPVLNLNMNNLSVKIGKLSNINAEASAFDLAANIEGVPLSAKGKINPFLGTPYLDLLIDLQNFDLMPAGGYFAEYIGYPLRSGVLNTSTKVKLESDNLDLNMGLSIAKFDYGEHIKDSKAPSIPLGLAVSMLQDFNGVITLNLPISGNINDPKFSSGGIVMKTFGNVLIKVVASPLTLIGSLVGGIAGGLSSSTDGDVQFLTFAPGDIRVNAESKKVVEAVVKLMQQKPGLNLKMQGCSDLSEKKALVEARILAKMRFLKHKKLASKERANTKVDDIIIDKNQDAKEYEELLFDVYADEPFDKPSTLGITKNASVEEMWQRIFDGTIASDSDLNDLALFRARNVRQYFIDLDPKMIPRTNIAESLGAQTAKEGQAKFNRVNIVVK